MTTLIRDTKLPSKIKIVLTRNGVTTLESLKFYPLKELLLMNLIGWKSIKEINKVLIEHGLEPYELEL